MRIRNAVAVLAAGLTLAACGGGGSKTDGAASSSPAPSATTASSAPAVTTTARAATATPSPKPAATKQKPVKARPSKSPKGCYPIRDVDVWYRGPGMSDSAQVLGSEGAADCRDTFRMLDSTSPTGAGYCTEAAWASDNPGYDADAEPAKRLKHVQVSVGPAC